MFQSVIYVTHNITFKKYINLLKYYIILKDVLELGVLIPERFHSFKRNTQGDCFS